MPVGVTTAADRNMATVISALTVIPALEAAANVAVPMAAAYSKAEIGFNRRRIGGAVRI
jgi:hypothetical protein